VVRPTYVCPNSVNGFYCYFLTHDHPVPLVCLLQQSMLCTMARKANNIQRAPAKKDISASYNRYKFFGGKQYTGMAVGRSLKWNYDKGTWVDRKITPEKWTISFEVKKRRRGKAPEGSGAPVGTGYHWFILAHQFVHKLDANTYSTEMNGVKFKLAHLRAATGKWNISDKTRKSHLVKILRDFADELESETIEEFIESEKPALSPTQRKKKARKKEMSPA
jgi:hypothetical protein